MSMRILALLIVCAAAKLSNNDKLFVTEDTLFHHKKTSTFETYSYGEHPFRGWTVGQVKGLMGLTYVPETKIVQTGDLSALPVSFNTKVNWPDCVLPVRDQGHCGSCWAHAASEVLSDRFCIQSAGKIKVDLSPQDMVSCDYLDLGCSGGIPMMSWTFLKYRGIVTESCKPYTSGDGSVERCHFFTSDCKDGSKFTKYYAANQYTFSSVQQIKENLMAKGPIETGFQVYADFLDYKSGIYTRNSDQLLGGHAVKVIGWGNKDGVDYWVVQNSWGPVWGENGHFNIAFNQCGVEGGMIAGDAYIK
jgi:cathepsin B